MKAKHDVVLASMTRNSVSTKPGLPQGDPIGSDRIKSEIEAILKRKVEPAKRGRPVKSRDNQRKGEQLLLAERK